MNFCFPDTKCCDHHKPMTFSQIHTRTTKKLCTDHWPRTPKPVFPPFFEFHGSESHFESFKGNHETNLKNKKKPSDFQEIMVYESVYTLSQVCTRGLNIFTTTIDDCQQSLFHLSQLVRCPLFFFDDTQTKIWNPSCPDFTCMRLWLGRHTSLLTSVFGEKVGVDVTEEQKARRWLWGRVLKIILGNPKDLTFLGERTKPNYKPWSSSIESGIFSNVIKCHTKTTLSIRQVEDHVGPGLPRSVPTIYVLFGTLFQEGVSNFAIHMVLMQNATVTEQNMRVSIL